MIFQRSLRVLDDFFYFSLSRVHRLNWNYHIGKIFAKNSINEYVHWWYNLFNPFLLKISNFLNNLNQMKFGECGYFQCPRIDLLSTRATWQQINPESPFSFSTSISSYLTERTGKNLLSHWYDPRMNFFILSEFILWEFGMEDMAQILKFLCPLICETANNINHICKYKLLKIIHLNEIFTRMRYRKLYNRKTTAHT